MSTTIARQPIVGFTGVAGSGKSTAASCLITQHGFTRLAMAQRLKAMVEALGVEPDVLNGNREAKETPHPALLGATPRHVLQTLGTEWGRSYMGEDFWVMLWERDALMLKTGVVCDDVRFPNEAAAIKRLGGFLVRITRNSAGSNINAAHASEILTESLPVDMEIENNYGLPSLREAVSLVALRART